MLFQHGGFSLQGGATYTDTRYGDDPLPDTELRRLPGATASFAPRWSLTMSTGYEWDLASDLVARVHVDAKHMTEYTPVPTWDLDPAKLQDAYTVANARIGRRDRHWMVELWGQYITDAEYMQVAFNAPLQTGSYNAFLGAPRTYGVTLRLSY